MAFDIDIDIDIDINKSVLEAESWLKELEEIKKKSPNFVSDREIDLVSKVYKSGIKSSGNNRLVFDTFSRVTSKEQMTKLMENIRPFGSENVWIKMFDTLEDIPQDRKLGKYIIQSAGDVYGRSNPSYLVDFYYKIMDGYGNDLYPKQLIHDSDLTSEMLKCVNKTFQDMDIVDKSWFKKDVSSFMNALVWEKVPDTDNNVSSMKKVLNETLEKSDIELVNFEYQKKMEWLKEDELRELNALKYKHKHKWSKKDLVDIFGQEQADKIAKELDIPESTSDIVSKETTELKKASDALRSGKKEDVLKYLESKGVDLSSLDKEERELLENICENGCKGGKAALKKAGKEIGEQLLKKAPLVGAFICLGSAVSYAEEGNYIKAVTEVANVIPIIEYGADAGEHLYTWATTDYRDINPYGTTSYVDANIVGEQRGTTGDRGKVELENYEGQKLRGGLDPEGIDYSKWRQAIVEEGKDQSSGSGNTEGGIEAQDGQVVAKVGDKVAQEGDVIATDPTKVAKVGEKGATIFDEPVADVNHFQKNASTKNGQVAKKDSAKSIENPSSIKSGSAKSTKNEKVENEEEYINKIKSSASTYYDDRIKNLFSSDEKCKEFMNFLSSKGISIPADPEIIFQTMYFTKEGNAMVTFFTDKNGKNFLGTSPEQREDLRYKMQRQHETSEAKGRVVASNSYDGKTSGSDKLDNALAQNDAKKATLAQNGAKKTTQTPALTNDINSGNTLA